MNIMGCVYCGCVGMHEFYLKLGVMIMMASVINNVNHVNAWWGWLCRIEINIFDI